ncbi:hypothetical protein CR513_52865, partial [Mucuna pruriens]
MLAETISTNEDKKQAGAVFTIPNGSDSEVVQEVNVDSNPTRIKATKLSRPKQPKAEIMSAHLVPSPNQVGQTDPKPLTEKSSSPSPTMELKPLSNHLKVETIRPSWHKPLHLHTQNLDGGGNQAHKATTKKTESDILDVVKKEVTKLLVVGIIYPISNSQWVSLVQVVPKKSGMTVARNQHDERLNQATRKNHFPLPFIDQVLKKLVRKSHYCFLDGFSGYMQIHIAPEDQHKTTFTCPFGTFAYTRMPFGLCNALGTFQRCMTSIFSDLL